MVVHIVMFRFKEEGRDENIRRVKSMLEALVEKIEPLRSMEVGVDFLHSERSMDLVLTSVFDDKEGLESYRVHPEHLKVVELIKEVTVESRVVDYVKGEG